MAALVRLESFVGNGRVVDVLERAIELERLPHAMIFAGPKGVGKRTLAELLALKLNCLSPDGHNACGRCRSCLKIVAGSHPDVRRVEPDGAWIRIDQIRGIIGEIAYQPFEASCRVVILDGAEKMRAEAANSLLKTLEEPPSRTVIIMITANPYLLLETIRSRSRMLQFGPISEKRIEEYLERVEGRTPEAARMAAVFCNGSVGSAIALDLDRYREARGEALRFVTMLLERTDFAEVSPLVAGQVKDKENLQVWMDSIVLLLEDVYYAQTAPSRMSQRDIEGELYSLAERTSRTAVISALKAFQELKIQLLRNANRQLALEALYLSAAGF